MNENNTKKIKKSDLSVTVILVLGIIMVVNFFSYQLFARLDLTQNKNFSISKVSKETVRELADVVNIKVYFSDNLPNQVLGLKQEVKDILGEYTAFSNGKIKVEYISPNNDEKTQQELYMIGIPQVTFQVYEKDRAQTVNAYFGMAVSYGDKTEAIPTIKKEASGLEYQLTTAIKKVISERIATIGMVTSHKTVSLDEAMPSAYKALQELYTVQQIEISDSAEIPNNVNTLVIAGAKDKFTDKQIAHIEKFVNKGGSLLVFQDGVGVEQGLQASKSDISLNKLFEKYGLKVNQNLVADNRSGMASFSQGFLSFSVPYPFWPKITKEGFNQNEAAVNNLTNVVLPWSSSIDIVKAQDDKTYTKLAFTTAKAWDISDNFNIIPNSLAAPTAQKEYTLAMSVSGKASLENADDKKEQFKGKVVLAGDSDFIQENFIRQNPDNLTLFQNLVDSVSLDNALIDIRSRIVSSRPIKDDLSDSTIAMIRYLNIFGVTVLVVAFGVARYFLRRKNKFVDEL
jgi:gliding-associated putative ABC transporter substrate-binding component GldG